MTRAFELTDLRYEVVQLEGEHPTVLARFSVHRDATDYCRQRTRRLFDRYTMEVYRLDDTGGREKKVGVYNGKVQSRTLTEMIND